MTASIVYTAADLAEKGEVFRDLTFDGERCPARLAVFGDPVAHSKSPQMHNAALQVQGKDCQYVRILVRPEELEEALHNLHSARFLGVNLTIPHKQAALKFVDEIDPDAQLMGAINTVAVQEEKLIGYNTDGPGFAAAIKEKFGVELKTLRILILGGGGGAGRAIAVQCAISQCPMIFVANRTLDKAESLSAEIEQSLQVAITPMSLSPQALADTPFEVDLIINATPLGMKPDDPSPLPDSVARLLTQDHLVYDTVYSGGTTALIRQAQAAGVRHANGRSMLLHQGAISYEHWFSEEAPLETMRAALRAVMG